MLRQAGILLVALALGMGAAIGLAACGEDREGDVTIETSGTGTAGTETEPVGTETAPTETVETVTEFETTPETESNGGATAPETESEDDGGATAP